MERALQDVGFDLEADLEYTDLALDEPSLFFSHPSTHRQLPSGECVYFIQAGAGGPIKIGTATDPLTRLGSLQTASAVRLTLLAAIAGGPALEASWHAEFAAHRLHGEWFEPTDLLLARIGELPQWPNR